MKSVAVSKKKKNNNNNNQWIVVCNMALSDWDSLSTILFCSDYVYTPGLDSSMDE